MRVNSFSHIISAVGNYKLKEDISKFFKLQTPLKKIYPEQNDFQASIPAETGWKATACRAILSLFLRLTGII